MRTEPRIFGNFVKLLKSTAPSSATLASYSFLFSSIRCRAHIHPHSCVSQRRVRTYVCMCEPQYTSRRYFLLRRFSLSLSVRLFLHFPGPLASEEDISFHSVITGEPNLHNTRVARAYRHLHFILIAVIDWISPATPQLAERPEWGGSRSAIQPVEQSATETEGCGSSTLNKNKVLCRGCARADALAIGVEAVILALTSWKLLHCRNSFVRPTSPRVFQRPQGWSYEGTNGYVTARHIRRNSFPRNGQNLWNWISPLDKNIHVKMIHPKTGDLTSDREIVLSTYAKRVHKFFRKIILS